MYVHSTNDPPHPPVRGWSVWSAVLRNEGSASLTGTRRVYVQLTSRVCQASLDHLTIEEACYICIPPSRARGKPHTGQKRELPWLPRKASRVCKKKPKKKSTTGQKEREESKTCTRKVLTAYLRTTHCKATIRHLTKRPGAGSPD